jgi:hypothetical protein
MRHSLTPFVLASQLDVGGSFAAEFGFATRCEAATLPRRNALSSIGLCPLVRAWHSRVAVKNYFSMDLLSFGFGLYRAEPERGAQPELNQRRYGGADPPPHIRRPGRNDNQSFNEACLYL